MDQREFYVYILAREKRLLYIGFSNNLDTRILYHKLHLKPGFTDKYFVNRLVYFETFDDPTEAIMREKQLKGWRREKKIKLIESINPNWEDFAYIEAADFHSIKQSIRPDDSVCSA